MLPLCFGTFPHLSLVPLGGSLEGWRVPPPLWCCFLRPPSLAAGCPRPGLCFPLPPPPPCPPLCGSVVCYSFGCPGANDNKRMEDSDPTDAYSVESWLRYHGSHRNQAYVPCTTGNTVHITQLADENFKVEHASTDGLHRTAQTSRLGQIPMNLNNVALYHNCNFEENAVLVGAIFKSNSYTRDLHTGQVDVFCGHV